MLKDLELRTLQERRRQLRLTFLYKVVKGQVPAINIEHFFKVQRPKQTIRAKQSEDFIQKNKLKIQLLITLSLFQQRRITTKIHSS